MNAPDCTDDDHETVKSDADAWGALASRGVQNHWDGSGQVIARYDLRNCPRCGSTLARPL